MPETISDNDYSVKGNSNMEFEWQDVDSFWALMINYNSFRIILMERVMGTRVMGTIEKKSFGKSPLHTMTLTSPTEFWNDSCSKEELNYAIDNGATGGTSNPLIVTEVLNKEMDSWRPRIVSLIEENPAATEDMIAWKIK